MQQYKAAQCDQEQNSNTEQCVAIGRAVMQCAAYDNLGTHHDHLNFGLPGNSVKPGQNLGPQGASPMFSLTPEGNERF